MMNQRGFTLVEVMIAMAVGLIALGSIAVVFQMQSNTLKREEMASEMRDTARRVMDRMTRELLMAGYDPTGNAGAGVVSGPDLSPPSSVNFTLDHDGDGAISGDRENVTYAYDSTNLTITRNARVIARNITGLSFTYYNSGNTATNTASDVRRIEIELNARSEGPLAGTGYLTHTISTDVTPRNLAF